MSIRPHKTSDVLIFSSWQQDIKTIGTLCRKKRKNWLLSKHLGWCLVGLGIVCWRKSQVWCSTHKAFFILLGRNFDYLVRSANVCSHLQSNIIPSTYVAVMYFSCRPLPPSLCPTFVRRNFYYDTMIDLTSSNGISRWRIRTMSILCHAIHESHPLIYSHTNRQSTR